jgi:hypothetical protein
MAEFEVLCITFLGTAEYAQVLRMLGNGRLEALCIDNIKRMCHIRGKMRKKVWVNTVRAHCCLHCLSANIMNIIVLVEAFYVAPATGSAFWYVQHWLGCDYTLC